MGKRIAAVNWNLGIRPGNHHQVRFYYRRFILKQKLYPDQCTESTSELEEAKTDYVGASLCKEISEFSKLSFILYKYLVEG